MPKFNFNIALCPETIKTVRDVCGWPPQLYHSSWTLYNAQSTLRVMSRWKKERNWPLQCNRSLFFFFFFLFAIHSWPHHQVVHIPWYTCCVTKRTLASADKPGRLQHTGKGRQRPHPLRKSPFHHDWGGLEPWDPLDKTAGHAANPAHGSKQVLLLTVLAKLVSLIHFQTHINRHTCMH